MATKQPSAERAANLNGVARSIIQELGTTEHRIVEEIRRRTDVLRKSLEIVDRDFHDMVERLRADIEAVIASVDSKGVTLKLDDLFREVVHLTERAEKIDAVDIETNRWERDRRAVHYLAANREALERGAVIRRVYVLTPNSNAEGLRQMCSTIADHLALNDKPEVRKRKGRIEVAGIFHDDMKTACRYKDFAIFRNGDDDIVLIEDFDNEWHSQFEGSISKKPQDLKKYSDYFDAIWTAATQMKTSADLETWEQAMRARIAGESRKYDLFFGYCSKARPQAEEVLAYLRGDLNISVLDWDEFARGHNIMDEVARADAECERGLFMFTPDDALEGGELFVPRDTVILEAGYFLRAKGRENVVILQQENVKPIVNLQGTIHIGFKRDVLADVPKRQLRRWVSTRSNRTAA